MGRARLIVAATIGFATACAASPADAALPGQNGQIAFSSDRDGNREIYVINPDGSGLANVTNDAATDDWPTVGPATSSSNGPVEFVFFASDRNGDSDVFRTTTSGSPAQPTTTGPGSQTQPAKWPGGDFDYLYLGDQEGNNEIYANDFLNSNVTNNPASDTAPAASADLNKIAFVSDRDGNNEVYTYNNGLARLTNDPASDAAPNLSPDSTSIAFETNRDGNNEIYVMNVDGTGQTRLTNDAASDRQPAWSPDGTKIVFQTNRDGNFELYTMNADGTGQTRLTNSRGADVNPDWGPFLERGYARPRGATPLRASLLPAYQECTAPNGTHGAPLAFGSCSPPVQLSGSLTIGSPDSNGAPAASIASVLLKVKVSRPEDVLIISDITDVRCLPTTSAAVCNSANATDGPDYSGELQVSFTNRMTDRTNGPSLEEPATVTDFSFEVDVGCSNTSPFTGGACGVSTTANAVLPGVVQDGQRAIWQMGEVEVHDSGTDGDLATTNDNALFLTQGVFVP
jgi:TolB protein